MNALLAIALSNMLVAAALAWVAVCASRLIQRPALSHALWVLVLLKLVTPPFWNVPVATSPITGVEPSANSVKDERGLPIEEKVFRAAEGKGQLDGIDHDWKEWLREEPAQVSELPVAPPSNGALMASASAAVHWLTWLVGAWLAGSVIWMSVAWRRVRQFQRLLGHGVPASLELQQRADGLAQRLGLTRCPRVVLLPGQVSPMLWALGREPLLLVPSALLDRLGADQQATLIAHELAHYRRRDHWVRWLEMLVMALYWWFPLVWWARRELHQAEEECCDAWVISVLPGAARLYADALVETLDFLEGSRAAVPLVASGLGGLPTLRRRLTMIMRGGTVRSLRGVWLLAVLGLAGLLLPLGASSADNSMTFDGNESGTVNDRDDGPLQDRGGDEQKGKGKGYAKGQSKEEEKRAGGSDLNLAKLKVKVEEAKAKIEDAKARYEQRLAEYNAALAQANVPEKKAPAVVQDKKGKGKGEKSPARLDEIERKLESLMEEIRNLRKTEKNIKKKD